MLRIPEKRQKKLFAGEKCSICDREANGIKYNAISCDSCRVFFRRIVLSMEKSNKTQLPCIRNKMSSSLFGLTAREASLKCQHCRFLACTNAGMCAEYVQGTAAFRNKKRKRESSGASQTGASSPNRARLTSSENSPAASPQSSNIFDFSSRSPSQQEQTSNALYRVPPVVQTFYTESSEVRRLLSFWEDYAGIRATSEMSMNRFQQNINGRFFGPPSPPQVATICSQTDRPVLRQKVSGLLFSHLEKVMGFVESLPFVTQFFPDKRQRDRITMSCFVELIVLRWAATTNARASMITGIDGANFSVAKTVSVGNNWGAKFKEYFLLSQRIRAIGVDQVDLSLMAGLVLLTSDRHDDLDQQQRNALSYVQELFATVLYQKASQAGQSSKVHKIFSILSSMRSKIKSLDLTPVSGFERRIMLTDDLTIKV
ncbi:Oidioi.mRNA.OKI2018_I69.chr1.g217.t1.cds [Oikopleura dioica]|uniref:Oidioi.mRNA.OKI2018_I69.chr1.g217.t1.cds n=1 Tax=Oikopleura dioica TaxID=34765 RepID=A0ABN7SJ69_OIKDI|nr:Oidioi.mRNA.OKI2018_I69.chr1.g217.t1.cds [Oikopleura dioica]